MAYEVLARKWRPQLFEEVVGQDHVVKTLRNAIEQKRIAQAYLFSGPRGTGKTTLARIFAKSLNCVHGPTPTPCGKCDPCKDIANGISFDVTEIDGASNNKVDDVHGKIIDTVDFAPTGGKHRIYYIDEVHMLSTSAFNALLKTLEEPPPYVKFIFATTEPEKVLGTILSRCQRFDLRRISTPAIVGQLRKIAEAEKIDVEADALLAIARGADGGMRDAESAFDQLIAFTGDKICEGDVLSVFGLVARRTIERLAGAVLLGDVREVLMRVEELDGSGKDLRRLTAELIEHFRNLLVCIQLDGATDGLDLTEDQCTVLLKQRQGCSATTVLTIVENMIDLESRLRQSLSPRTLLETALIRCARASKLVDLEVLLGRLNKLAAAAGPEGGTAPTPEKAAPPPPPEKDVPEPKAPPRRTPSEADAALASAPTPVSEAERNERVAERPVVQEALKAFDGQITNISHKHEHEPQGIPDNGNT